MPQPDELIQRAFRPKGQGAQPAVHMGYAWDNGWKIGDVVYAPAATYATWSANLREKLTVEGARLVRPIVATHGRFIVGGWKANHYVEGTLSRRIDETAALAVRLEKALAAAGTTVPTGRTDIFAQAEFAAWEESGEGYDPHAFDSIPLVAGHADAVGTTIYHGTNPPAMVDIVPTAALRPQGYSAALCIVDGLIAQAVDPAICDRFAHIAAMDQLLLRAVAYRRHVNNLHPGAKMTVRARIEEVENSLLGRVVHT